MDNKCPVCGQDLLKVGTTTILSNSQKIIHHWINKSPIECNSCKTYLEINNHHLERTNFLVNLLLYVFFVIAVNKKYIPENYIWYTVPVFLGVLILIKRAFQARLLSWPRYKVFESQTKKELALGILATTILFLALLIPMVLGVWAVIELYS